MLGSQGIWLLAVIILSMGHITEKRLAVSTHDKQVEIGVATKVVENICGVAELLPRCERLMLYRLGNVTQA